MKKDKYEGTSFAGPVHFINYKRMHEGWFYSIYSVDVESHESDGKVIKRNIFWIGKVMDSNNQVELTEWAVTAIGTYNYHFSGEENCIEDYEEAKKIFSRMERDKIQDYTHNNDYDSISCTIIKDQLTK